MSFLSQHLELSSEGHLERALHVIGYLNEHKKLIITFDCGQHEFYDMMLKEYDWFDFYRYTKGNVPPNIPEERENYGTVSMFVDASCGGNKVDRLSQTGIFILL